MVSLPGVPTTAPLHNEFVEFIDPADPTWSWRFELSFFLSHYNCIWGRGCKSTDCDLSTRGCCPNGVHIVSEPGDAEEQADLASIIEHVGQMTADDWQNKPLVDARGGGLDAWSKQRGPEGTVHTRLHRGACIFHNRDDHPDGPGCSLHQAALKRGESPLDWKPTTCWMVPLFTTTDHEERVKTVGPVRHDDWGGEGLLDWWCVDDPIAYQGEKPAYRYFEDELRRICGDAVYEALRDHCDQRRAGAPSALPMHHPVNFIGYDEATPNGTTGMPLPMAEVSND